MENSFSSHRSLLPVGRRGRGGRAVDGKIILRFHLKQQKIMKKETNRGLKKIDSKKFAEKCMLDEEGIPFSSSGRNIG